MHNSISRGIDRLLRLDFPSDTSELGLRRHEGKTVNAYEMIDALECLRIWFEDTRAMLGQGMYRGEKEFDFVHDVMEAVKDYYLAESSNDEKEKALARRKYNSMVTLMLKPIIYSFQNLTHEEALESYNDVIDAALNDIVECDAESSAVDAMVVAKVIQKETARRNKVAHAVEGIMRLRRRKRKRRKKAA